MTVVIASAGYPESARTGDVISGADGAGFVHAGTARSASGELVTAGGRVLSATAAPVRFRISMTVSDDGIRSTIFFSTDQ